MRTFTSFSEADPVARKLVDELPTLTAQPELYRAHMVALGHHLAEGILRALAPSHGSQICVISTVEDADFLTRGLINRFEEAGLGAQVHLLCLWNKRIKGNGVTISPILREYKEDFDTDNSIFVVVKSIISGACVVKTNLTRAISFAQPKRIFVAAPVMLKGAENRLAHEFPQSISSKFEFVHFATDTEMDGDNVVPGVGGSVYELLGLGNSETKNRYVPSLVKERRKDHFPQESVSV